jgi:hypothetical protein
MGKHLRETEEVVAEYRSIQASLRLWRRDFERLIEYVEPMDTHDAVYSHRIFELLLRAATEFESVAKVYAHHAKIQQPNRPTLPDRPTIHDYRTVLQSLELQRVWVGLLHWRPKTRYVSPFPSWGSGQDSPDWYRAYNEAKHSRRDAFAKATLLNAITAFAGVFATLIIGFGSYTWPSIKPRRVSGDLPGAAAVELHFEDFPFTLCAPEGFF